MTDAPKSAAQGSGEAAPPATGGLPFAWSDMSLARVRPARFAELMQVTRSCVSGWVKRGWIDLFPDGTLDPKAAAESVLKRGNPARLRSRLFKTAASSADALRLRVAELEAQLAERESGGDSMPAMNPAGAAAEAFAAARAKREHFAAARAELEFQRAAAELLSASDVVSVVSDAVTRIRCALESLPARLALRLVGLDEAAARGLLVDEVEAALDTLAHDFATLTKAGERRPGAPT